MLQKENKLHHLSNCDGWFGGQCESDCPMKNVNEYESSSVQSLYDFKVGLADYYLRLENLRITDEWWED